MQVLSRTGLGLLVMSMAIALAVVPFIQDEGTARPQYNKIFKSDYGSKVSANCGICHPDGGKDKKSRNAFGKAVEKGVGAKNQKDEAVIADAIKKALGEKSGVDGKTFGDLVNDGKPPAGE